MLEVARIDDDQAIAALFRNLALTPGQPPLSQKVPPELRGRLEALLVRVGVPESRFSGVETWAAAVTMAQALQGGSNSGFGIDRALKSEAGAKPVEELEGAAMQLGIFDSLPEADQRDLLAAIVRDADDADGETRRQAQAWRRGDMKAIEAETRSGMLADPELRMALFTSRNRVWEAKLGAMLAGGAHPFVAVGAAHMAGPDGLPALLAASGYTVTRLQ